NIVDRICKYCQMGDKRRRGDGRMNTTQAMEQLYGADKDSRYEAYLYLLNATKQPVDWAYEYWKALEELLEHKDNHVRTIAAQLLSQLAISDNEQRIVDVLPKLLKVTFDTKFVTARHSLQA